MFGSLFDDAWLRQIQKQAELAQSVQRSVNLDMIRMISQAGAKQRYQLDQIARTVDAMRIAPVVSESYRAMAVLGQSMEAVRRTFDALPSGLFNYLQQVQSTWLAAAHATASFARLQQQLAVDLTQLLQEQARSYQMLVGQNKFDEAFMFCADYMFLAALNGVKNTDDAHDAVQEAYIKAIVSVAAHGLRSKEPKALRNWFYTIARNAALDIFRQRKYLVSYEARGIDVMFQNSFEQPEAYLMRQELYQEVHQVFLSLSEIEHKVIFMRYFGEEGGWNAIAARLECPSSSARTHHTRGIRILQKHLEKYAMSKADLKADLATILDAFAQEHLCIELYEAQDG